MPAGKLRESVTLQEWIETDDGAGNVTTDWADRFTAAAGIEFMRGSETVIAARLTARQPAIMTIRNSAQARAVRPSWRAVNARTAEVYNIRERPREAKSNRGYLEVLVEAGVQT